MHPTHLNRLRCCSLLLPLFAFCISQAQTPYEKLIRQIQAEEVNFPFPQKDTIITIGTIDVGGPFPAITYAIPISGIVNQHDPGWVASTGDLGMRGPNKPIRVGEKYINDTTFNIAAGNYLHMTLRFNVVNWRANTPTVTLNLGTQSNVIPAGSKSFDVPDFLETNPAIIVWFPNAKPVPPNNSQFITQFLHGHFLNITWDVAGMGIVTMPVLPVKIIYAPVVDSKSSNTASIADTKVLGYSTSMSINSVNSTTLPEPTDLSTLDDFLTEEQAEGKVLSAIPVTAVAGKAITDITGFLKDGLGSSTITSTVSNSVTNTVNFSADSSETDQITAKSSVGGPGVGDVIAFYINAKLIWLSINGKMQLALLGYDQTLKLPSVSQLSTALAGLKGKPAGTLDPIWGIDAVSIQALIDLDPFTSPQGQYTQLDPTRFTLAKKTDGTDANFQVGAGDVNGSVSHQVQASDAHAQALVKSTLEVDKPGFLSYYGLGETEDKTIQYSFSRSTSSGYTVGETLTGQFVLHGDGKNDHYKCAVYFDNVFGTFAFRDFSRDLDINNAVKGTLVATQNHPLGNTEVTLNTGEHTYTTTTDEQGNFNFTLPRDQKEQELTLSSGNAGVKVNFQGHSLNNVRISAP